MVLSLLSMSALTWWVALRRSTRGRLPLVLVGVPAAFELLTQRLEAGLANREESPGVVFGERRVLNSVSMRAHAGEVCGKEATLALLRDLVGGAHAAWADSLVLLVAPIYNADGNERVSLYNRPEQHGPIGGMGQRPNAQGYDLNRDHMKLDAPETRSLVRALDAYDPHVVLDLHTTNGTYHAYHLTYSPPLNPNTYAPLVDRLRGEWEGQQPGRGRYPQETSDSHGLLLGTR